MNDILLGSITAVYLRSVDIKLDGGRSLRNVPVMLNISGLLLVVGRRVAVLNHPKPVVIGVISDEVLGDDVSVYYNIIKDIEIGGTLDLTLPGVIKCMADGWVDGVGFWFDYNQGNPRGFMGDSSGSYWSFDAETGVMEIVGTLRTSGGPYFTPTGAVSPQPNLLRNPDFEDKRYGHMAPMDWVLTGQSVILEDIVP